MKAEDTVFELHSFFFKRDSARFRTLLAGRDPNMDSPLVLPDTRAVDLERFLEGDPDDSRLELECDIASSAAVVKGRCQEVYLT